MAESDNHFLLDDRISLDHPQDSSVFEMDVTPESKVSNLSVSESDCDGQSSQFQSIHQFPHSRSESRDSFIPTELARTQIKKIQNEMMKMHQRHCILLNDMDQNYATIERETHQRYIEFINKWKDQLKTKIQQYRKVIESMSSEIQESKTASESVINQLQEKVNKLTLQKQEVLTNYNRDLTEKELIKEQAISSMQAAYQRQFEEMNKDKLKMNNAFEELLADKESIQKYCVQLREEYEEREDGIHQLESRYDSLSEKLETTLAHYHTQVPSLLLQNLIWELEFNNAHQEQKDYSSYMRLHQQFEQFKKERNTIKQNITQWIKQFEEEHGRTPTNADKDPIKSLYVKYMSLDKKCKTLAKRIKNLKDKSGEPRRARSSSPGLNISLDSANRVNQKERLEKLEKENTQLKKKLRNPQQSPAQADIAGSIIANSKAQDLNQLRQEKEYYKQQFLSLQQILQNNPQEAFQQSIDSLKAQNQSLRVKSEELKKLVHTQLQEKEQLKSEYEQIINRLTDSITLNTPEVRTLKAQIAYMTQSLTSSRRKKGSEQQLKQLQESNQQLQNHTQQLQSKLKKQRKQTNQLESKLKKISQQLKISLVEKEKLKKEVFTQQEKITSQLTRTQQQNKLLKQEKSTLSLRSQMITKQHQELKMMFTLKEQELKDASRQRKLLHNQLEDLRGKIRVFCRVRPMNSLQSSQGSSNITTIGDHFTVNCETKQGIRSFSYDSVFGPNASQQEIFEDTKRLIQSAVDGFNVCIFAYGQTGSGKTYTIQGEPENPGIVLRATDEIFMLLNSLSSLYQWEVTCYMVSHYMYSLVDLLRTRNDPQVKLTIKTDQKGMVYIPEAIQRQVNSPEELREIYFQGIQRRQTGRTRMNDMSSRSHLIFSILIAVTNSQTGERTVGKMSLVDLAGGERAKKAEATADGLKEAKAINSSLLALGNVIKGLSSGDSHIRYRDSILTKLMTDSLGGSAKTLMFVNISPASYNREETIISLYYGSQVKLIKNEPAKNIESREMSRLKQDYMKVCEERDKLKETLCKYVD